MYSVSPFSFLLYSLDNIHSVFVRRNVSNLDSGKWVDVQIGYLGTKIWLKKVKYL